MVVGGQRHAPYALPSERTWYMLYRRLGGPQDRSGQLRKISPLTGIRSPGRLARIESLYRLSSYRSSPNSVTVNSLFVYVGKVDNCVLSFDLTRYKLYFGFHTLQGISWPAEQLLAYLRACAVWFCVIQTGIHGFFSPVIP